MTTTAFDQPELPELDRAADERTTLFEMLDYYRAVLLRKCWDLNAEQLSNSTPPTDMTLGGLLLHMALVEDYWFDHRFAGHDEQSLWADIPWDEDHDWEFHHAHEWTSEELIEQIEASIGRSREAVKSVASLDRMAQLTRDDGTRWNLRWIVVHMIEEYARHCGHADLMRESIDGLTGD